MNKKYGIAAVYMLIGAAVGVGCFYGFVIFVFNISDSGFFGKGDKRLAILAAVLAIALSCGYLFAGYKLFGQLFVLLGCFAIMLGFLIFLGAVTG
jgi:hypothetical protein